jgi:hypothetical protein
MYLPIVFGPKEISAQLHHKVFESEPIVATTEIARRLDTIVPHTNHEAFAISLQPREIRASLIGVHAFGCSTQRYRSWAGDVHPVVSLFVGRRGARLR